MVPAFERLAGCLEAVAEFVEHLPDLVLAHPESLGLQLACESSGALAGPPKRRFGIFSGHGIDQRLERLVDPGLLLADGLGPGAVAPDLHEILRRTVLSDLLHPVQHRRAREARRTCNRLAATPPKRKRLRPRPQSTGPLVHMRGHQLEPVRDVFFGGHVHLRSHLARLVDPPSSGRLIGSRALGFLDDDPLKWDTTVHGIRVLGRTDQLQEIAERLGARQVLITIANAPCHSGKRA
jgi:hypothetical protein